MQVANSLWRCWRVRMTRSISERIVRRRSVERSCRKAFSGPEPMSESLHGRFLDGTKNRPGSAFLRLLGEGVIAVEVAGRVGDVREVEGVGEVEALGRVGRVQRMARLLVTDVDMRGMGLSTARGARAARKEHLAACPVLWQLVQAPLN